MTQGTDQPDWIYTLAEKVGAALFVNGNGDEAQRLVLELSNGRYGGGWSRNPACDAIDRVLRAELAAAAKVLADVLAYLEYCEQTGDFPMNPGVGEVDVEYRMLMNATELRRLRAGK